MSKRASINRRGAVNLIRCNANRRASTRSFWNSCVFDLEIRNPRYRNSKTETIIITAVEQWKNSEEKSKRPTNRKSLIGEEKKKSQKSPEGKHNARKIHWLFLSGMQKILHPLCEEVGFAPPPPGGSVRMTPGASILHHRTFFPPERIRSACKWKIFLQTWDNTHVCVFNVSTTLNFDFERDDEKMVSYRVLWKILIHSGW